jgi:catechol 2,3-dioxygenase-like lactoylglutathione lyase family enzyme
MPKVPGSLERFSGSCCAWAIWSERSPGCPMMWCIAATAKSRHSRAGDTLAVGDRFVRLVEGDPGPGDRPLLNHLAVLVDSASDWRDAATELGVEVTNEKDAANTYAVFLRGPDSISIEYVEHKPTFALT